MLDGFCLGFSLFNAQLLQRWRQQALWLQSLVLFSLMMFVCQIVLGKDVRLLIQLMPVVSWLILLFVNLFAMDDLFASASVYGVLMQMRLAVISLSTLMAHKLFSFWLVNILPFVFIIFFYAWLLGASFVESSVLAGSLLCATPMLTLLSAIAAALTYTICRSYLLLVLLVVPLYLPVLIVAFSACEASQLGLLVWPYFNLLIASSLIFSLLTPYVLGFILKHSLSVSVLS